MPCKHPHILIQDGKKKFLFEPEQEIPLSLHGYPKVLIGCGQCLCCRLENSKQKATRQILEMRTQKEKGMEENWFVTLTYDNENVPYSEYFAKYTFGENGELIETINTITGELLHEIHNKTLSPKDLQDFNKRLREHINYHYHTLEEHPLIFYGCGEYGEKRHRPHYHANYINLPLNEIGDLKQVGITEEHNPLYESPTITKLWGKGIVRIGKLEWQSAAYVARYILKKQNTKLMDAYNNLTMTPEFIRCSTAISRPGRFTYNEDTKEYKIKKTGIGEQYFEDHWKDIYKNDEIILKVNNNKTISVIPPKYFDERLKHKDEDLYKYIKEKRCTSAQEAEAIKNAATTLSQKERLEAEERVKIAKAKMLKRNRTE